MRPNPTLHRLAAAVALALATAAHAEAPFSFEATPGKLPKDVVPIEYVAHLVPDVANNTFSGSETVEIEVLKPTSKIVLNVLNMEIDDAALSGNGVAVKLTPQIDKAQQTLTFALEQPLATGRYSLSLKFRGTINREARGLFYMNYKVGSADKRMIASTMEPTDARRMLPLWDEPVFRARFRLTVDVPATFKAYSNTPIERQDKLAGGLQRVSFAPTPKMPSYLVVLVAGELERSVSSQGGVEIGVVTTEGKQGSTEFVMKSTKELLRYYNNYFGVPYPLAKLDQIAIPGGFNGAMENWGGIVYNDAALLYDPKKSTDYMKQTSFSVNAHEVAHQWFGNLVTMAWWDNLWLNEGFASWMGFKATERFHPEWRGALEATLRRDGVMNLDARKTTHPIQTPVLTEAQAANAFDAITYGKGQAFLLMLENYLGERAFRKGMRAYMAKHKYSNTTSADLWAALEKASGKPVAKIASDWTTLSGFPVVKVDQVCENGQRKVTLTQEHFTLDDSSDAQRMWSVPVQVGSVGGKSAYTLLTGKSATVTQPNCEGAVVVDPNSVGYFRVQYAPAAFEALASQAGKLPDATRLKLLSDAWGMVAADRLPLASYLKLASSFGNEPRQAVWETIIGKLGALDAMAVGEPQRAKLNRFTIDLLAPKFKQLGWDEKAGESSEDRALRGELATALARAGDPAVIAEGRARFQRFVADPASVAPAMLDFTMYVAGRYADAATYDQMRKLVMKTESTEERNRYGFALTGAMDPALAAQSLELALSSELPNQLTTHVAASVARNEHIDLAWKFAVEHREALLKNQDTLGANRMFPAIVSSSSNAAHADMMEAYVAQNFGADAQPEAKRVAAGIRIRAKQKERMLPQLAAALK